MGHREILSSPPIYGLWDLEKIRSSMDMKRVSIAGTWKGMFLEGLDRNFPGQLITEDVILDFREGVRQRK